MYTLYTISLGCSKNLVDTERMLARLLRRPVDPVDDPAAADIIFINTCGFILDAKDESISTIVEHSQFKQDGRCQVLIVAGCLVTLYEQQLRQELPEVDIFIDTKESSMESIGDQLSRRLVNFTPQDHLEALPGERLLTTPSYMAYLKIAEGCSNTCTYCVIPRIRGPYQSVPQEKLVSEARELAASGVRELVLISQDSTEYGLDLYGKRSLAPLLAELAKIENLHWIRVLYTYPNHFDDELIETIAREPKICKYVDIPFQHMSNSVLKRMNRHIRVEQMENLVQRLRQRIPGIAIRTTMLTGFPGETEADFQALLEGVERVEFDHLGAFAYSDEELAASHKLPGKVNPDTARERAEALMELQHSISLRRNEQRVDQTFEVLVEGISQETELLLQGRASFQAPEVDGHILINDGTAHPGDFVMVRIEQALPYDLVGGMVDS
ncbi:30S ribosomal protein S12 methylthiotransferase RimO [Desulfurispirillum indicum]|uniref:30S ribosomal protein S12 methylthiotransferase RimO n=1 Tax=Desulfurispirillum indicum TaxID=936456 RepID=UPI001CF9DF59|nr:30S ribosomal protein S12 methylthiotransferase RimO [Desulfurispirillum indicum]UCZ57883.1 30S ribosomal protein S12 methylthiotransferase RimO [Desulfurispirillum indicum]